MGNEEHNMAEQQRRHPNVVNIAELEGRPSAMGTKFAAVTKPLAVSTGARGVGCTWTEVPPGKTAWPRHFHCVNEEALFILEGEGTLHIGEATVPVRPGDHVTFPVGPDFAHQLLNTGTAPLRYLSLSTLHTADVVGYPDSKKIAATALPSVDPAGRAQPWVRVIAYADSKVAYYDGEDVG
jgi:uncharacterized cupin superfamily protein